MVYPQRMTFCNLYIDRHTCMLEQILTLEGQRLVSPFLLSTQFVRSTLYNLKTSAFTNSFPIDQNGHRDGYQEYRDEAQERVSPAEAQRVVHGEARQWYQRSHDGAPDCVGGEGGSGVYGEGVEEVGLYGYLGQRHQIGRC